MGVWQSSVPAPGQHKNLCAGDSPNAIYVLQVERGLGQALIAQGWGVHPPHLYCVDLLLCLGCGSREIQSDQKNY